MSDGEPLFCEQSDLTYKCSGHYGDVDQPLHLDYVNHTLAYPPDVPRYWQTAFLLYYTDVETHKRLQRSVLGSIIGTRFYGLRYTSGRSAQSYTTMK